MKISFILLTLIIFSSSCEKPPSDMIYIPAGEFLLGIKPDDNPQPFMSEKTAGLSSQPQQKFHVEAFQIDRFEVTYADFLRFKPKAHYPTERQNEPIRAINWHEADAYCLWLGKRLPTEFEWEKAARGTDDRVFVWGNEFNRKFANWGKKVLPAQSFDKDISHYGVRGMNGNVAEWTSSWYAAYLNSTHEDENFGEKMKVIRGGGIQKREHGFMETFVTITYRTVAPPKNRFWDTGFRCAKSAPGQSR